MRSHNGSQQKNVLAHLPSCRFLIFSTLHYRQKLALLSMLMFAHYFQDIKIRFCSRKVPSGPYPKIFWGHRFLKWQLFLTDTVVPWGQKNYEFLKPQILQKLVQWSQIHNISTIKNSNITCIIYKKIVLNASKREGMIANLLLESIIPTQWKL